MPREVIQWPKRLSRMNQSFRAMAPRSLYGLCVAKSKDLELLFHSNSSDSTCPNLLSKGGPKCRG